MVGGNKRELKEKIENGLHPRFESVDVTYF